MVKLTIFNNYWHRKNSDLIDFDSVYQQFRRFGLREKSAKVYACVLGKFCKQKDIVPCDFPNLGLEHIEQLTEDFILDNINTLAPKSLNVYYSSIKTWCYIQRMIKSRKNFKEIKFDKTSRKVDALTETPLETRHIKQMMKICDAHEKVLVGLYGLCGLRPSLIPQLRIENLHQADYELEKGKIKFTKKNPMVFIPRHCKGNKAKITFFVILPSRLAELVEYVLNKNSVVTQETGLISKYRSYNSIYYKIATIFEKVGFSGRPYLLRSYADRLLDKTITDEDLKEFMLGHKGKISAIYQFRQLTEEDKSVYLNDYQTTDEWINKNIFEAGTEKQVDQAEAVARFAKSIGVEENVISEFLKEFKIGKLTMTQYEQRIAEVTERTLDQKMETKFEQLYLKMEAKHNNQGAK